MCYHAEYGCSVLKRVGITTGKKQNLGALGTAPLVVGSWLTP